MNAHLDYRAFLEAKIAIAAPSGFAVADGDINPILKPHQRAIVKWACAGGRRAIFAAFGLGKSVMQIEILRLVLARFGGRGLIVAPLGVRQEFRRDLETLNTGNHPEITDAQRAELAQWLAADPSRRMDLIFIRSIEQAPAEGLCITNYETVRDEKLDPNDFTVTTLDEASALRGMGGTKTFRAFMRLFDRVQFKFVATATPSPNQFVELLAYSAYLGIMDIGQAKTRFFKRNSEKADQLTIHPHKQDEFWLWVASWGLFVQRPSDLGFSDAGYDLPEMEVNWHEIPADHANAGVEKSGQMRLLRNAAVSLSDTAREKRDSLPARIDKLMALRAEDPLAHRIIWHDLEAERHALEKAIPGLGTVFGSQDLDAREQAIIDFSDGRLPELGAKPVLAGSGCNFQRHCHWAIFLGIGFKFNDFIQAIHRIQRFLQKHTVRIDLIYTEAERPVREQLEAKWKRDREQRQIMTDIIKKYGLSEAAMADRLKRAMGVERIEVSGENYRLVNNDCVLECRSMADNSVDLIVTSIPFSTQYEYSPNYADFGHTDDNEHFWAQMDFLIPELLRVLKPGRVAMIHVKDRIVPGGLTGLGFQTVYPFSDACVARFQAHGFAFMSRKTITTDVVRENNQTYRLGWSEQCKDGTKMGNGLPEYGLMFRKPPSENSNSYADQPVKKQKREWKDGAWTNETGYSRARWQLDAHGFARSSGDRMIAPEELVGLEASAVYRLWKRFSLDAVYDFEHHVKIAESMEERGQLPSTFMLLPPHAPHPDVWSDITRMLSMNTLQAGQGRELHLCPLQFDFVDRTIAQFSQPGELVFDPFGGLMTVPYRALKQGRKGMAVELNPAYFLDGAKYVEAEAEAMAMPSLFDLLVAEDAAE